MNTEENPPLVVGRRIQWPQVAKVVRWAAVIGGIVTGSIFSYRVGNAETRARVAEAEARAKKAAREAADVTLQVTSPYAEKLERRITADEVRLTALEARRPKGPRKPPKPAAPPPAPLPKNLNAAEAQLKRPAMVTPPDAGGQ